MIYVQITLIDTKICIISITKMIFIEIVFLVRYLTTMTLGAKEAQKTAFHLIFQH